MSHDPTEMCRLLVGLGDVTVRAGIDSSPTTPLIVEIETSVAAAVTCALCGATATIKDRAPVTLVDLPAFGRPARLRWVKRGLPHGGG
ncbi:transposase family protein [Nitriliruptoraceae bacterium ZYF776]|nr:transposase family protein [Profundirhabdus halotolerans]